MNMLVRDTRPALCVRTQRIELRLARPDDATRIGELFGAWFPRSYWATCLTYEPSKTIPWIARGIQNGVEPFVLAHDGDELVGCISWHLDSRFTEPVGVLDEVYVAQRLRFSDLGRRLIAMAMHIAKAEGASVFNFPIASGMPEQQGLINMLTRHFGAQPIGVILTKVM